MSLFHRHRWQTTGEKHVPGTMEKGGSFEFGGGFWGQEASDALYGFTLISQKCCECGDVRTVKLTGKFEGGEQ